MNILFLTIGRFLDINDRGIYTDLMRKFKTEGHNVYVVSPSERRYTEKGGLKKENGINLLHVRTLNVQKTNLIEKGLSTLTVERVFLKQIKKYFNEVKFDLVIYSTPPITFTKVIEYIKNKDNARSYLLLKDIFPQNAVDLGMLKQAGILHKFFLRKEKALYNISDFIGCMSPANVDFIIRNNPEIDKSKLEVNPNSLEPVLDLLSKSEIETIRSQYSVPNDATVFIYGGNLGKPQGIDFLISVLESNRDNEDAFFVIVGDGTEFNLIKRAIDESKISNVLLLKSLPKQLYDELLRSCDVGLIFLDRRFTIPNFPSRLLSYMDARMPVLSATDINTDIGYIMQDNGFGLWCESEDLAKFNTNLQTLIKDNNMIKLMGKKAYQYMLDNYSVENSYQKIMNKIQNV